MEKITPFYNIFKVTHAFLESLSGHDQTYEAGFGLIVGIEICCQGDVNKMFWANLADFGH